MLSAIALEDLFWQEMEYFPKILFNISFVALLAFVLDKLQTVRAVSSVKHQDLRQSLVKIKFRNTEKLKVEKVKVLKIEKSESSDLANLAILALSRGVGSGVVGYNISVRDFTVSAAWGGGNMIIGVHLQQ